MRMCIEVLQATCLRRIYLTPLMNHRLLLGWLLKLLHREKFMKRKDEIHKTTVAWHFPFMCTCAWECICMCGGICIIHIFICTCVCGCVLFLCMCHTALRYLSNSYAWWLSNPKVIPPTVHYIYTHFKLSYISIFGARPWVWLIMAEGNM